MIFEIATIGLEESIVYMSAEIMKYYELLLIYDLYLYIIHLMENA